MLLVLWKSLANCETETLWCPSETFNFVFTLATNETLETEKLDLLCTQIISLHITKYCFKTEKYSTAVKVCTG
jgi:hypothetical protein